MVTCSNENIVYYIWFYYIINCFSKSSTNRKKERKKEMNSSGILKASYLKFERHLISSTVINTLKNVIFGGSCCFYGNYWSELKAGSKSPEICTLRKSVTSHELVSDMEAWTINVFFGGQPSCKCHRVISKRAEIFWIGKHIATLESPMLGLAWRSSAQIDNIIICPANRPTKTLGWKLTGKHAVTFIIFFVWLSA